MAIARDLEGPFFLEEVEGEGEGDCVVLETLDDILYDTDDVLWGDEYVGYDSAGRRFRLAVVAEETRYFFNLLSHWDEYRVFLEVEDEPRYEEAREKVVAWIVAVAPHAGVQASVPEAWLEVAPLKDLLEGAYALGL